MLDLPVGIFKYKELDVSADSIELTDELLDAWIANLTSGKFVQRQNRLVDRTEHHKQCCLGVLLSTIDRLNIFTIGLATTDRHLTRHGHQINRGVLTSLNDTRDHYPVRAIAALKDIPNDEHLAHNIDVWFKQFSIGVE